MAKLLKTHNCNVVDIRLLIRELSSLNHSSKNTLQFIQENTLALDKTTIRCLLEGPQQLAKLALSNPQLPVSERDFIISALRSKHNFLIGMAQELLPNPSLEDLAEILSPINSIDDLSEQKKQLVERLWSSVMQLPLTEANTLECILANGLKLGLADELTLNLLNKILLINEAKLISNYKTAIISQILIKGLAIAGNNRALLINSLSVDELIELIVDAATQNKVNLFNELWLLSALKETSRYQIFSQIAQERPKSINSNILKLLTASLSGITHFAALSSEDKDNILNGIIKLSCCADSVYNEFALSLLLEHAANMDGRQLYRLTSEAVLCDNYFQAAIAINVLIKAKNNSYQEVDKIKAAFDLIIINENISNANMSGYTANGLRQLKAILADLYNAHLELL